jgi:hypothetical protein
MEKNKLAQSCDFNPAAVECEIRAVHDNVELFSMMTVSVECNGTFDQPS